MLFDVPAYVPYCPLIPHSSLAYRLHPSSADNTNLNPTSPYTFYDASCPSEVPVGKRSPQLDISLGIPVGINISLDLGPKGISSACSCLITSGPASTTVTKTQSSAVITTATVTSTTTRTVGAA